MKDERNEEKLKRGAMEAKGQRLLGNSRAGWRDG